MTTTNQRVDPLTEPGPTQDRAGLLGAWRWVPSCSSSLSRWH